uniref:Putative movement protein n=1 Tax=Pelargonium line pattern virus TaxID=167019 RepID=C6F3J4_9TOMB|nr:putative movement protein [Pelargonium line pattern virus]ACJ38440.1 putative movement protein [Pelargonium line pattern virus]
MEYPRVHLAILSVLILSQLLIKWNLWSISISSCLPQPHLLHPNLLVCIVLCIFFSSVLSQGQSYSYSYFSTSTSDKFISVAVGNGGQG